MMNDEVCTARFVKKEFRSSADQGYCDKSGIESTAPCVTRSLYWILLLRLLLVFLIYDGNYIDGIHKLLVC